MWFCNCYFWPLRTKAPVLLYGSKIAPVKGKTSGADFGSFFGQWAVGSGHVCFPYYLLPHNLASFFSTYVSSTLTLRCSRMGGPGRHGRCARCTPAGVLRRQHRGSGGRESRNGAARRCRTQDRRKLQTALHRGEGFWVQGFLLPPDHPAVHVPGIQRRTYRLF